MIRNRRSEVLTALVLIAPFVALYLWMFVYPTYQMVQLSLYNAPLIGPGKWVGFGNYVRMFKDPVFRKKWEDLGTPVVAGTPEQFGQLIRTESVRLGRVVRESGATVD